jgi:hypothetical protein
MAGHGRHGGLNVHSGPLPPNAGGITGATRKPASNPTLALGPYQHADDPRLRQLVYVGDSSSLCFIDKDQLGIPLDGQGNNLSLAFVQFSL